jgi:anti-anti-sigma regulatory factor
MLKILRSVNGKVVFILSGRIESQDVEELQRLLDLESEHHRLALDLKDVTLVDPDAVKALARWEAEGVRLENCPKYVREWIEREGFRRTGQKGASSHRSKPGGSS